jgi:hypothetical protein
MVSASSPRRAVAVTAPFARRWYEIVAPGGERRDAREVRGERAGHRGAGRELGGGEESARMLRADVVAEARIIGQPDARAAVVDVEQLEPQVVVERDRARERGLDRFVDGQFGAPSSRAGLPHHTGCGSGAHYPA